MEHVELSRGSTYGECLYVASLNRISRRGQPGRKIETKGTRLDGKARERYLARLKIGLCDIVKIRK